MDRCKPMETPLATNWRKEDATSCEEEDAIIYRKLVGSLMYLVKTWPDMCYAVKKLSQAVVRPAKLFCRVGKHVLWYLRGTTQFGLWYRQKEGVKLCGFIDANWVGSPLDWKTTSSGIFSVGSIVVSWYNTKQRYVALNTEKVEYMANNQATCEVI